MARASKILGYILLYGAMGIIALSLFMVYLEFGFSRVREILNPFNIWNLIATAIALAPGFFFIWLGEWLEKRKSG